MCACEAGGGISTERATRGQVVDVLLRVQRDLASAEAFFEQALRRRGVIPVVVITDKHPAYVTSGPACIAPTA